ncbi:NAD(P)/FAD-dependent oxidoreductase [Alteribacillus sp. JSM 102045]|uniref:NAD(P)/FAD-dependent oxidoreductase n=1 Tax=Alteribacillus sp. JSM 102045 TaxID=1562101 RepID=UPI0035C16D59
MSQHVVFIGAGDANLSILKNWKKRKLKDTNWTLISPSRYQYYSGMFSGYAEGRYNTEDIRIDLKAFCKEHEGRFLEEKVTAVDKNQKSILTDSGKSISYDLLSANIGSFHEKPNVPGVKDYALFIDRNNEFPLTAEKLQRTEYPVIAGGDYTGVELALSLQEWRKRHHMKTPVTLISDGPVLKNEKEDIREDVLTLLDERGIMIYENTSVERMDEDVLYTENRVIPYGETLWLTGPTPPLIFQYAKLPVDKKGFLLVSSTLQSPEDPSIFASGACVTLKDYPELPRNSVYTQQEASVLEDNIVKKLKGKKKLKKFAPQKKTEMLFNLAHKKGLYIKGSKYSLNKSSWKLKNRMDKQFIKQFS